MESVRFSEDVWSGDVLLLWLNFLGRMVCLGWSYHSYLKNEANITVAQEFQRGVHTSNLEAT